MFSAIHSNLCAVPSLHQEWDRGIRAQTILSIRSSRMLPGRVLPFPSYSSSLLPLPCWCFHLDPPILHLSLLTDTVCPTKGSQPPQMRIQLASCSAARHQPPTLVREACSFSSAAARLTGAYTGNKSTEETLGKSREGCMHREGTDMNQITQQITHMHNGKQFLPLTERLFCQNRKIALKKTKRKTRNPCFIAPGAPKPDRTQKAKRASADYKATWRIL